MEDFSNMTQAEQWVVSTMPGEIMISKPDDIQIIIKGKDVTWDVIKLLASVITEMNEQNFQEGLSAGKNSAITNISVAFKNLISDAVNEE